MPQIKKIAITGFSRSGTTALTDLLNIDPRILITYEFRSFTDKRRNRRRKWDDRNASLKKKSSELLYIGDKATRPYIKDWDELIEKTDKIILCLRDPRDIFLSKYWKLIKEDPMRLYINLMGGLLKKDLTGICIVRYEKAVNDVFCMTKYSSDYLELGELEIGGHNYKPVRRFGWLNKPEIKLPNEVVDIMREFGYESTGLR